MEKSEMPTQHHTSYSMDQKNEADDNVVEKSPAGMEAMIEETGEEEEDDYDYPKSWKLGLISAALCLSVFCMALVCGIVLERREKL
jgi:hypothetical protein